MPKQKTSWSGRYLCFCVFFILIIDSGLSSLLGVQDMIYTVAYAPFLLYFISYLWQKGFKKTTNSTIFFKLIFLGIICIILKFIFTGEDYIKTCIYYLIFPYMLAYCLDSISESEQRLLRKFLFIILFIEIGLAIYERITLSPVLAAEDSYILMLSKGNSWSFRASALYGHPLLNAFLVMIITLFIAASDFKLKNKIFLILICFVGLLCFNERGNIIITAFGVIAILFCQYGKLSKKQKSKFVFAWIFISVAFIFVLVNTELGGRLFLNEHTLTSDSSARLAAFNSFSFLNNDQLLWGSKDFYDMVLNMLNRTGNHTGGIENGYIAIILNYGLLLGIPIIYLLTKMQYKLLSVYQFKTMIFIILPFIIIAFTNPHISGGRPWLMFIISYYAITPYYFLTAKRR